MQKIHYPSADYGHNPPPPASRITQIYKLFLLKALVLSLLTSSSGIIKAQDPCGYNFATITLPASFGPPGFVPELDICDLAFTVDLAIEQSYLVNHDYTVAFTFNPTFFSLSGTTPSISLTPATDPFGNTVLTGTFTATSDGLDGAVSHLLAHFSRNTTWPANDANITFTVSDLSCTPTLVENISQDFAIVPHVDLRPVAETRLSELLANGTIVLSPGSTSLPHLLIDDELVIDVPASLIGEANAFKEVVLMPGARIRIATDNPGAGLTPNLFMTEANVHTCPGTEMADGIVIDPQNTSGIPLTKLQMQNSVVADCRFGINARPNSSFRLENNQFTNNYIGVNLDMSSVPSGMARARIDGFASNTFSTNGQLKPRYQGMPEQVESRGYCGIRLINYRDFNIWGGNTFSQLANGIIGTNSIGNLGNLIFNDMNSVDAQPKYLHEGFGIRLASKGVHWFNINEFWTSMTFDNCKTGIFASNYALNVENTTMTNVGVGIDVSLSKIRDIVLDGNTITARQYGIRSGLNEPVHSISTIRNNEITITAGLTALNDFTAGIQMDEIGLGFTPLPGQTVPLPFGTDGWEVNGNVVTMKLGGNGILYNNGFSGTIQNNDVTNEAQANDYKGILTEGTTFSDVTANTVDQVLSTGVGASMAIYSSGGFANTFQCNCVDNTDVGLQFFDMADFEDAVRGNNFNTHCTGLQLGTQAIGGAYIGRQYHTGNLWDLSAITGSCLGGRNYGDPALSPFFVNGTANLALNPAVFPSSGWFHNEPGTTFSGCATCTFPPQIPPRVTESSVPTTLDQAIATGTLTSSVFANEMSWKGKYRLYRKILRQPALESYSSAYSTFKSANQNLSVGKLAHIAEEKAKLFALTAPEDSTLESHRSAWRQSMEALRQLDSLRQAGVPVNQTQYDARVQQSATAQTQYEQYAAGLKQARQQNIQTLLTLNAAVTTSLTPDASQKTVNGILLNYLLSDTLASGNLATLVSIAEQCPLEGGDAVYEARAIVSHFTGQGFNDLEQCEDNERQQRPEDSAKLSEAGSVVLYPNPTTGQLFWSGTGDQPVAIRVFNGLGQLAAEMTSANGSADLEQLPEGLYTLQIFAPDNTVLATEKIQIVKN
ncbi:MAG: hypothetical protein EPGJADBJ_00626 [Saprospiraceae bacterium]|nr:hypothetical protein [Saprospiraceae bacterium]